MWYCRHQCVLRHSPREIRCSANWFHEERPSACVSNRPDSCCVRISGSRGHIQYIPTQDFRAVNFRFYRHSSRPAPMEDARLLGQDDFPTHAATCPVWPPAAATPFPPLAHAWVPPTLIAVTVSLFFSWCNLHCSFCQNRDISHRGTGREIELDELDHLVLPEDSADTEQVLAFVTTEVSTSTDLNLMEQYHTCYSAWENPPLDRPPRAGEFETAMAIAATHGLHRIDRRLGHRYPASSLQHPNE